MRHSQAPVRRSRAPVRRSWAPVVVQVQVQVSVLVPPGRSRGPAAALAAAVEQQQERVQDPARMLGQRAPRTVRDRSPGMENRAPRILVPQESPGCRRGPCTRQPGGSLHWAARQHHEGRQKNGHVGVKEEEKCPRPAPQLHNGACHGGESNSVLGNADAAAYLASAGFTCEYATLRHEHTNVAQWAS